MKSRAGSISVRELAKIAGVSPSTVSLALNDSTKLPEATKSRIKQIAKKHGFIKNTRLAGILKATVSTRYDNKGEVIAWIETRNKRADWDKNSPSFIAMSERAAEYGYKAEPFWFFEEGMSPQRSNQILKSRGITGLLIKSPPYALRQNGRLTLPIEWESFCTVEVDDTITEPRLNRVRHNHLGGIWMTLRELEQMGYRRIGFCVLKNIELATHHRWTAGYFYWGKLRGLNIEPLICERYNPEEIARWIQYYQLDVVISPGIEVLTALESIGMSIPREVGYASLDVQGEAMSNIAGINQQRYLQHSMAVDLLVTLLHRGAKGVPNAPICWLANSKWQTGKTLVHRENAPQIPTLDEAVFSTSNVYLTSRVSGKSAG